jgi:hypothetical protein
MSETPELAKEDPRRKPEFAVLWAAMAEADWLEFTGEEDSEALRILLREYQRLKARRRRRLLLLLSLLLVACTVGVVLLLGSCSRQDPPPAADSEHKANGTVETAAMVRKSYVESGEELKRLGLLEADKPPPLPERRPRHDDQEFGVSFFRTEVSEVRLENLSLPRTFASRSEFSGVSFAGTDLSESSLCWNNFSAVDFTRAVLRDADLRASVFEKVKFDRADLSGADLRHGSFVNCTFQGAILQGALLSRSMGQSISLSEAQRKEINWQADEGPEPEGG